MQQQFGRWIIDSHFPAPGTPTQGVEAGYMANAWVRLKLNPPVPPGTYYLEASEPDGRIGWWSHNEDKFPRGEAFACCAMASAVAGEFASAVKTSLLCSLNCLRNQRLD